MIRRPPRSTLSSSSAASDVYKRQTIRLSDAGHHNQHHCYFIEISSASVGKIDSAAFFFDAELTARIDTRNDYKGGFYVWHDADWYIAKPARNEIDAMADKIFAFISMYEGV